MRGGVQICADSRRIVRWANTTQTGQCSLFQKYRFLKKPCICSHDQRRRFFIDFGGYECPTLVGSSQKKLGVRSLPCQKGAENGRPEQLGPPCCAERHLATATFCVRFWQPKSGAQKVAFAEAGPPKVPPRAAGWTHKVFRTAVCGRPLAREAPQTQLFRAGPN